MRLASPLVAVAFLHAIAAVQVIGPVTNLTISNAFIAPDGFSRSAVLAGGTFPGSLITAQSPTAQFNITVQNRLTDTSMDVATSVSWHGMFQRNSSWADGVPYVTQCPLQPGNDFSYVFAAGGQSGTYWYHSMQNVQDCDGLRGGLVIYDPNDPYKSMYDVDDASTVITLADWYHTKGPAVLAQTNPGPYAYPDSTLINGLGRAWNSTKTTALSVVSVVHGKRYRLRIISISCFPAFAFSIDNHTFAIIEADGVLHQPYVVDNVTIYAGQRYSAILTANQTVSNYWIRALPVANGLSWSSAGPFVNGINSAILRYTGAQLVDPTTPLIASTNLFVESLLVPYQPLAAPGGANLNGNGVQTIEIDIELVAGTFTYSVNDQVNTLPTTPALSQILSGVDVNDLVPSSDYIPISANSVVQLRLYGGDSYPDTRHPIHLNGHQFYVIKSGDQTTYNYNNPPRRDVISGGDLHQSVIIRFVANNAGPWMFSDLISWHRVAGYFLVFVEDSSANIRASINPPGAWSDLCGAPTSTSSPSPSSTRTSSSSTASPTSTGTTLPAGWSVAYTCAVDDGTVRIFASDSFIQILKNTPSACVSQCASLGYPLAGVEYSNECYCGTGYTNGVTPTAASANDCSMSCPGDPSQTCGGQLRIQVYSNPNLNSIPVGWSTAYACAVDTGAHIFGSYASNAAASSTPGVCAKWCASKGYPLAGVEGASQCYCGGSFAGGAAPAPAAKSDCNAPCTGDASQTCGGSSRMQIYSGPSWTGLPAGWALAYACAVDDPSQRIFGLASAQSQSNYNTPAACASLCAAQGFTLAGVEYTNECFCGTGYVNGVAPTSAPASNCNMPCSGDANQMCGGNSRIQVYSYTSR